jgi:hypothetical protein
VGDLNLLLKDQWLNSNVINFYLRFLMNRSIQFLKVFSTWDMLANWRNARWKQRTQEEEKDKSYDIFVAPVNWTNTHWGLLGYSAAEGKYFWYEGKGSPIYQINTAQLESFNSLILTTCPNLTLPTKTEFRPVRLKSTLQGKYDGWSCGLRVLFLSRCISKEFGKFISKDFSDWMRDNLSMRQLVAQDLIMNHGNSSPNANQSSSTQVQWHFG